MELQVYVEQAADAQVAVQVSTTAHLPCLQVTSLLNSRTPGISQQSQM